MVARRECAHAGRPLSSQNPAGRGAEGEPGETRPVEQRGRKANGRIQSDLSRRSQKQQSLVSRSRATESRDVPTKRQGRTRTAAERDRRSDQAAQGVAGKG